MCPTHSTNTVYTVVRAVVRPLFCI